MPRLCHLPARKTNITLVISGLLVVLSGCGGSGPPPPATAPPPFIADLWPAPTGDAEALTAHRAGCDVLAGPARPGGTFTVAVTDPVAPAHAPVPVNRAERLVFAQLYETLVNVSCDGTIAPGLATAWTCTDDSTAWVFTLRDNARFWDGTRVTADDVQQAWKHNQQQHPNQPAGSPWRWLAAADRTITAADANHLIVRLPEPQAQFPWLLAHPATAVAVTRAGWTWPVGSGPARLRASDPAPLPDLRCLPNLHHPAQPIWKTLTFQVLPGRDRRDLAGGDLDLTLAEGNDTVDFFREMPGFQVLPLPWTRLHVLVCPPKMNRDGPDAWRAGAQGLHVARDMGTITTRPWSHVMFPVSGGGRCPQLRGPIAENQGNPLAPVVLGNRLDAQSIAYLGTDPGSAELAARLSHLVGAGVNIATCSATELALALHDQLAGACLLAVDQIFPTGCLQWAGFIGRAPWLQDLALSVPTQVVVPLALSRRWLIVRGELAGLRLAFDGTPLLAGLGHSAPPEITP